MAVQVYSNIFHQEIPLPNNPLKALNCYIIRSKDRALLIDTGFNHEAGKASLMETLKELEIDLKKTDLVLTHLHADHSGLAAFLEDQGAVVYASQLDGEYINQMQEPGFMEDVQRRAVLMDLEKDGVRFDDNPAMLYAPEKRVNFIPLQEGQTLSVGDYTFQVVFVPGHTPGHIGLYEPAHRLFFGGDHVLNRITPNITFWEFDIPSLADYLQSLRKVYGLEVDLLFPAHRTLVENHRDRIEALIAHHVQRLAEIVEIIGDAALTVRDVASRMHWELRYPDWASFPHPQKWFASGEAMSHLEYLVGTGQLERSLVDGIVYYSKRPE